MKPALSPQMTGLLPRVATRALTSSSTTSSVTTVRMISTRFCTGAGLKKWMPMTRPGSALAVEISVTLSEEVLVVRMHSGVTIPSSSRKIDFLISSDSTTASTTRSAPGELLELGRKPDPTEELGLLGLGELLALHGAVGGVLEVGAPAVDRFVVELDADDVEAVAGEDLRDSGPHGAESDHADGAEVTSHGPHPSTRSRDAGRVSGHPSTSCTTSPAQPPARVTPAPPCP